MFLINYIKLLVIILFEKLISDFYKFFNYYKIYKIKIIFSFKINLYESVIYKFFLLLYLKF
jgi:hypothetical protein